MGFLRVFLAIVVIINHTGPLFGLVFTDAYIAVKIFFIISGFYMALILNEKYTGPGSCRLFFTNRFLRLYPTYWRVVVFSVGASLAFHHYLDYTLVLGPWLTHAHKLTDSSILTFVAANMLIFGQDFLFFTSLSPETGQLVLDANSMAAIQPAWFYLAAPQAWTLSVELTFYLIAPFVIRRGLGTLMLLIAASLAVRAAVWLAALPLDPWCQRFTPAELCFFLPGVVCYHIYVRLKTSRPRPAVLKAITFPYLAFLLLYQFIPGEASFTKDYATYLMTVIALPFLFYYTKSIKWDRRVGELSYPIYISHWLVIVVMRYFFSPGWMPAMSIVGTLALSVLITVFFNNPIERYRQKRVLRAA
jgi:peptidoglycan/LPS O-acetylase OafA/YrhL